MTPEVCSICGREILSGSWAIDLDDDTARHEDCGPRKPRRRIRVVGIDGNEVTAMPGPQPLQFNFGGANEAR